MEGAPLPAFLAASLLLAVTPGPGVVYIVTRTLAQGRAAGLASAAGVACGNALNAVGAAVGLAAVFGLWRGTFDAVKWAGAAYLVWLGWRMWRSAAEAPGAAPPGASPSVPLGRLWRDGFIVALLNPKTTLFFAAFLPQFMDLRGPALGQALVLGGVFVAIAAVTDAAYVLLAATLGPALVGRRRAVRLGRRASGVALVALGVLAASSAGPTARVRP